MYKPFLSNDIDLLMCEKACLELNLHLSFNSQIVLEELSLEVYAGRWKFFHFPGIRRGSILESPPSIYWGLYEERREHPKRKQMFNSNRTPLIQNWVLLTLLPLLFGEPQITTIPSLVDVGSFITYPLWNTTLGRAWHVNALELVIILWMILVTKTRATIHCARLEKFETEVKFINSNEDFQATPRAYNKDTKIHRKHFWTKHMTAKSYCGRHKSAKCWPAAICNATKVLRSEYKSQ